MKRLHKEEKGVVSIAMAILIPVIIMGVLYVYAMLDKPQQENAVHKIVYASSEAYLSRYNAYLFDQMGILANLDSDGLDPLIRHYLLQNKRIVSREDAILAIDFEQLNVPSIYSAAVVEASNQLIGNAILDYGIDLLNQFAFADQIRTLNQSIENHEKKLSEQFEKSGATQFLKTIMQCKSAQSGKYALTKLEGYINKQYEMYFRTLDGLKSELTRFKEATSNPEQAMTAFIKAKEAQWRDSEEAFMNMHHGYMQTMSKIEALFECIESDEASLRQLANQVDVEKTHTPVDKDAINRLEAIIYEIDATIDGYFSELDEIVSERIDLNVSKPPSIIDGLRAIILEAEYLFSGIEVGSGVLILEEAFKHSTNDSENSDASSVALPQKVKMNEYYLSVFSSYDLKCPRVFDPQNRHKALRTIKGEVEYLVSGLMNEKQSVSYVRLKIVAVRSAANVVTLLSDKDKLARLSAATVALPQPWRSIAYGAAIAAWSGLESYSDINRLMKGEGFYFFKTQAQWALDFDALLDGTWKHKVKSKSTEVSTNHRPVDIMQDKQSDLSTQIARVMDPNMYYLDYLRLLLAIQDEQLTLLRAMDLVEAELLGISDGKTSLVNFSRGHMIRLTWKPQGVFGLLSNDNSTLHMRNGFE